MKRIKNHSALLNKYTLMYEKKPRSRVFAPLSETYRKLGMIDEALKILKKGIAQHPTYTLGYIVLSNCYFDRQNYEMAYTSIRPFVSQNLENITLQKLFAKTCLNLGHLEEALATFKNLLLINPKDKYVAEQVKLLEDDLILSDEEQIKVETNNNSSSFDENDWVQVDFSSLEDEQESISAENDMSEWSMATRSPLDHFKEEVKKSEIEVEEHHLDDKYFHENFDNQSDDVILPDSDLSNNAEAPIITHTLVELYCNQGHFKKAQDVLHSILELHPEDEATQRKLVEIQTLMKERPQSESPVLIGQKKEEKIAKIEQTFKNFLSKLIQISEQKVV